MRHTLKTSLPFTLESGATLPELNITYYTYGELNAEKDNVIWICHALTASGDVADWWANMVGPDKAYDTNKYFIICANILGSCYGTTGPNAINPITKLAYGIEFPFITIRDMVQAHILLQKHLNVEKIYLLVGGSMGGYQALEWAIIAPTTIQNLFLIATAAEESAWGKAIHTAQRLAIKSDPQWELGIIGQGDAGLKAARGIGMLSYRNFEIFNAQQQDEDVNKLEEHKAAHYIIYQGEKLANRFDTVTYFKLTMAMDTHQIARNRDIDSANTLKKIKQPSLIIGISSDILCPPSEQKHLATHMENAVYHEINSAYGHDGFLIEAEKIGKILKEWLNDLQP